MKPATFLSLLIALRLICGCADPVAAQTPFGNRSKNPFQVTFQLSWEMPLQDPVKLIEIGPVTESDKNSLVMLVEGKTRSDLSRKLVVTHWDGFRLATDFSTDCLGSTPDALLVGHFRTVPVALAPPNSKTAPPVTHQIVTAEGVYEWSGHALKRLFESPPDLKMAILLDKSSDRLLTGIGDKTVVYEIGDKDAHPYPNELPADADGYARSGIGAQEFPGSETLNMTPGVRYVQSFWSQQNRWMIGLARGRSAGIPDRPEVTTGDRLVVYTSKPGSREKNFWASGQSDLEEAWRSEPLPGRILDVRVGDPKNEGKLGLLVLTAQNNDTERHLTFFVATQGAGSGS
jgi:hypothetical protein